jgi:hypothetical protein
MRQNENSVSNYRKQIANKQKDEEINKKFDDDHKNKSSNFLLYAFIILLIFFGVIVGIYIGSFMDEKPNIQNNTPPIIININNTQEEKPIEPENKTIEIENKSINETENDSYDNYYNELDFDEEMWWKDGE